MEIKSDATADASAHDHGSNPHLQYKLLKVLGGHGFFSDHFRKLRALNYVESIGQPMQKKD